MRLADHLPLRTPGQRQRTLVRAINRELNAAFDAQERARPLAERIRIRTDDELEAAWKTHVADHFDEIAQRHLQVDEWLDPAQELFLAGKLGKNRTRWVALYQFHRQVARLSRGRLGACVLRRGRFAAEGSDDTLGTEFSRAWYPYPGTVSRLGTYCAALGTITQTPRPRRSTVRRITPLGRGVISLLALVLSNRKTVRRARWRKQKTARRAKIHPRVQNRRRKS